VNKKHWSEVASELADWFRSNGFEITIESSMKLAEIIKGLQTTKAPPKPKVPKEKKTSPEIFILAKHYAECFTARYKSPIEPTPTDFRHCKSVLAAVSLNEAKGLIDFFF
jgi:hypothetical protein